MADKNFTQKIRENSINQYYCNYTGKEIVNIAESKNIVVAKGNTIQTIKNIIDRKFNKKKKL